MKTVIILLGIAVASILNVCSQGTINWGNSGSTPILLSTGGLTPRIATAADGLTFGLYYGPSGSSADALVLLPNATAVIGNTPGVLSGASAVSIPGIDAGQTISVQVRAWTQPGQFLQGPPVRTISVGSPAGPPPIGEIWTADPTSRTFVLVPEPASMALAAIGGWLWWLCRRAKR